MGFDLDSAAFGLNESENHLTEGNEYLRRYSSAFSLAEGGEVTANQMAPVRDALLSRLALDELVRRTPPGAAIRIDLVASYEILFVQGQLRHQP